MGLFRGPKQPPTITPPDPADIQNRRDSERQRRLSRGGTRSTLVARAVGRAREVTTPTATLTGVGG